MNSILQGMSGQFVEVLSLIWKILTSPNTWICAAENLNRAGWCPPL